MRYFRNKNGAEDEIRTRDPRLGKAILHPEPLPHAFIIHMWSAKTIFLYSITDDAFRQRGLVIFWGDFMNAIRVWCSMAGAVSTAALQDSCHTFLCFYSLFCGISGIHAKPFARSSSGRDSIAHFTNRCTSDRRPDRSSRYL